MEDTCMWGVCIHILRTWQLIETLGLIRIVYAEAKQQRGKSFCFLHKREFQNQGS